MTVTESDKYNDCHTETQKLTHSNLVTLNTGSSSSSDSDLE